MGHRRGKQSRRRRERSVARSEGYELRDPVEDREELARITQLVEALPRIYRQVIELRYRHKLSPLQISEVAKLRHNTVRTRLRRAEQLLRDAGLRAPRRGPTSRR